MISARQIPRGTSRVRTVSFPAPVGGWNARDSIGDMDKLDAVTLTNFFPGTTSVQLRQGYGRHADGFTGPVETHTLKAWYLPINAIGGAATALDHSSICEQGGHLVAAMTWTLDAGYGMDDHLVFITSSGEVVVWRLTDPTTPTGIAMIGLFQ